MGIDILSIVFFRQFLGFFRLSALHQSGDQRIMAKIQNDGISFSMVEGPAEETRELFLFFFCNFLILPFFQIGNKLFVPFVLLANLNIWKKFDNVLFV